LKQEQREIEKREKEEQEQREKEEQEQERKREKDRKRAEETTTATTASDLLARLTKFGKQEEGQKSQSKVEVPPKRNN
jgi:hypothetical protein